MPNLQIYKNIKKQILLVENLFLLMLMKLLFIICMQNINYYTSYYHDCKSDKLNLIHGKSYYYDDLFNNGEIQKSRKKTFKSKLEFISNFNPFIVIYGKTN